MDREGAPARDGDGLRVMDPVESARGRSSMPIDDSGDGIMVGVISDRSETVWYS